MGFNPPCNPAGAQAPAEAVGAGASRAWRDASLVLGLAQPGDTLLYLLLPLYHAAFGVSLGEAGLLLAANRLVRIAGYRWIGRFYARRGPRTACGCAAVAATLATLGYAVLSGLWALLIARLLWGLAFAALNIATQALTTAEPEFAARRSGRSRSIIAAGPMLGLLCGAVVSQAAGPRTAFLVLAAAALPAIPLALRLPAAEGGAVRRLAVRARLALPSRLDLWSFVQGLTLDGLFVIGLSLLAAAAVPRHAALAAGATLALRYAAEIVLGPVGGALAERHGARLVLVRLSIASAVGLALVGVGMLWLGAVAVVLLRGLIQPLPAPVVVADHPQAARIPALARLATWRDIGAGTGPLLAGLLLPAIPAPALYGAAAALLAASAALVAIRRG